MNSAFGIYFMVLSGGMVLYYVGIIAYDLLRKDGKKEENVEEFLTADDDEDTSTHVSLVGGDIRFGDDAPGAGGPAADDGDDDGAVTDGDDDDPGLFDAPEDETSFNDYEDGEDLTAEQYALLKEQLEVNMEPVVPDYQHVYDSTAFHVVMRSPKAVRQKVLRTYAADES